MILYHAKSYILNYIILLKCLYYCYTTDIQTRSKMLTTNSDTSSNCNFTEEI